MPGSDGGRHMPKICFHALRAEIVQQPWSLHLPAVNALTALVRSDAPQELQPYSTQQSSSKMQVAGGTAIIPIVGILQPRVNLITSYYGGTATSQVEDDFRRALSDSQVRRIVLVVDSPGGSAQGNEEVARTIFGARGAKPITAFVRGMAASAAYYIASAADKIVASPSSAIGSIGTLLMHFEESKYDDAIGFKITPIFHGERKADGNQFTPLNEQSRKTLQQYVDAYGDQFVNAVARHRATTPEGVRQTYGQGQVFLADEALRRGMVDQVGVLNVSSDPASHVTVTSAVRTKLRSSGAVPYSASDDDCRRAIKRFADRSRLGKAKVDTMLARGSENDLMSIIGR